MKMRKTIVLMIAATVLFCGSYSNADVSGTTRYTITDLGLLNGSDENMPFDLNDAGQVVGV